MDKQAFKQRMQNLKSYRENNPGKGYWDWKVEAFADGGVNNNIIGSYSNHTGTPTMYVPVTKEYEAVPEGFGEIVNVHTPEVTITPQSNISLVEAVDKGRRTAFENIKEAASYTPIVGDAMDVSDAVQQATQGNYSKAAILGGMALLPNVIQKPIQKFAKLFKSNKKLHDLNIVDARDYTSSKPNVINSNKSVIKYKRKPIIQQQKQNNMLDATEQNRNTIKPVGEFVHTQTISDNIDEYMYRDPMQLANHEMNHYTDYIISRNANTSINNNMLKQLENSLKQTDATSYYRKGTEQKAYMNQLRTMLKQNGDIQNLDEPVSSTLLKKYLDKMSDSDPIKKMFKQHKNINAYTKWFNTIPLLGTTALGANAYFNNNKDE